jgi:hypothetical protein
VRECGLPTEPSRVVASRDEQIRRDVHADALALQQPGAHGRDERSQVTVQLRDLDV